MPESRFFYSHHGQQYGPVAGQQLKQLAAQGHVAPEDHVWREGGSRRFVARDLKGLFPSTARQVPSGNAPPTRSAAESRPPEAEAVGDVAYIPCPHCQNFIIADPSLAGQTVQCPHCSVRFPLPGSKTPIDPPPTATDSSSNDPLEFLNRPTDDNARPADVGPRVHGLPRKPKSFMNTVVSETFGELHTSIKKGSKKATKAAIKMAIGFVCLVVLCSGIGLVNRLVPKTEYIELRANVTFDGTQFDISNLDEFDWTDVELNINSVSYFHEVKSIPMGNTYSVGAMLFAKRDGTRFNPFNTKVQEIFFTANTPKGKGRYYHPFE